MIDANLQRIAAWFSNRASARTPQEGGDWIPILKHVHQHLNPKPRCRSVAQQLMNEEPDVIKAAFKATYGDRTDMNKIERLNKLNEIARELTTTEYAEMVPELEQRAKEVHARELKEWELDLDKVEEAEDVSLYVSPSVRQLFATDTLLQRTRYPFLRRPPSIAIHWTLFRVLRHPARCRPGRYRRQTLLLHVRQPADTFFGTKD